MYNARKAFLRSKNDKNRPGWSFDINITLYQSKEHLILFL